MEVALQCLVAAGTLDRQMVGRACDFLASSAAPGGAVRSPLRPEDVIEAHLDRARRDQQADGGWSITWEPPSVASTLEYRGMATLRSLRVLAANGRLPGVSPAAPTRTAAQE